VNALYVTSGKKKAGEHEKVDKKWKVFSWRQYALATRNEMENF
jgi:hypothetical protein